MLSLGYDEIVPIHSKTVDQYVKSLYALINIPSSLLSTFTKCLAERYAIQKKRNGSKNIFKRNTQIFAKKDCFPCGTQRHFRAKTLRKRKQV